LLLGSNVDEGNLYLAPMGLMSGVTDDDLRATTALFHPDPDAVLAAYRQRRPGASIALLRAAVLGDGLFGDGTRRMARAHAATTVASTFVYEFAWRSNALDGLLGACHTLELPFVFDRLDLPSLRGPSALLGSGVPPAGVARRMHSAWLRFAATGEPGWPRHRPEQPYIERIDARL